jgi:DMSO/TMAO reductase YedYZ molybdopterin-dependent catalytic subunit
MDETTGHSKDSIVARRLRYIERQQKLGHGVNVQFKGLLPQGSGPANRHGLPAVPIDQHVVPNWPVLDLGEIPNIPLAEWRLQIAGLVENRVTLTWDAFMELPQTDDVSDFHCVTSWSRLENHWRGVRFTTLAELAVPHESAAWVLTAGYDRDGDSGESYTTNLPLARAVADDVLLVHTWEGRPLPPEHGGPCRMITPRLYAWKGTKWIRKIEFLDHNQRGFWERRGYSDSAEPWFNDRYSS